MAASASSDNWETVFEDASQFDESILMAFLEESQMEEAEDKQLGSVIRSLQEEVDSRAASEPNDAYGSCNWVMGGLDDDDEQDRSRSMCQLDDPFDWVDMDVGPCEEMGEWYLDMGVAQVEMAGYAEDVDYTSSSFSYYGGGYSGEEVVEQDYIPLWQETFDYRM